MTFFKRSISPLFKTKRVNIFLLFIVLAVLFSVLTKLSNKYTRTFSFQANPINVPEDIVVINDSTNVLRITISAFGFRQIKYYFTNPKIDIDFSSLDKKNTHFNWIAKRELPNVIQQFNINEKIINISPDTLTFRYDTDSVKMVPVLLNSEVKFSSGFDLTETFRLEPDSIKIIGPKVIIDTILEVNTEKLTLDNVNSNITSHVKIKLPNQNQDLKFSHTEVQVFGTVEKFTEGTVDVPINIINVPKGVKINYYPKEVSVIYYTSLSNFNSISSSSFIIECDYNSLTDNDLYLIPKIVKQPDFVKNARLNVNRIEFILVQ